MIVAVFGDLHGHFALAYRLLRRWEIEQERRCDLILQVGDVNAFPDPARADRLTLKFAARDAEQLSFARWQQGAAEAAAYLAPDAPAETAIAAPLLFVKGNHDDYAYLEALAARQPGGAIAIDPWHRILYLPSGRLFELRTPDATLRVAALGGIADPDGRASEGPQPDHYTRAELLAVAGLPGPIDVLLTHDAPWGTVMPRAGSRDVTELIALLAPAFHFCGHYHEPGRALAVPAPTRSFQLDATKPATRTGEVRAGCFGILDWRGRAAGSRFAFVDAPRLAALARLPEKPVARSAGDVDV
jgi:Icc-related predicted phosphoesterase